MKLFYSTTSPFSRKCLVVAHELGIADKIECTPVKNTPINQDSRVCAQNPLGKHPVLVANDGTALYDSKVICEYLNHVADGSLLPGGEDRWPVLVGQTLADGVLEAALLIRYETTLRPAEAQWPDWQTAQKEKIMRAVARFQQAAHHWQQTIDLRTIATACALSYLNLRMPDLPWREQYPHLEAWHTGFSHRPSMQRTEFQV